MQNLCQIIYIQYYQITVESIYYYLVQIIIILILQRNKELHTYFDYFILCWIWKYIEKYRKYRDYFFK